MLALSLLVAMSGQQLPQEQPSVWFMFFMKGPAERPSMDELQKMQKGHMDNLIALGTSKKAVAAGPLNDPTKERRGIVILTVPTREDVDACFTTDPYVKADIMRVAAMRWRVSPESFSAEIQPDSIAPHHLILWKRGMGKSAINAQMLQERQKLIDDWKASKLIRLHGLVTDRATAPKLGETPKPEESPVVEIAMVEGGDQKILEQRLAEDPFVKRALLTVEVIPLWMSKGILK